MSQTTGRSGRPWWESGVVYQVYPRSFQDSDGVDDLEGIRRRLDYIKALGVDAIWLSPIFPSPMADFGYDVADYCGVDPLFGDLAAFDRLLGDVHARGLSIARVRSTGRRSRRSQASVSPRREWPTTT